MGSHGMERYGMVWKFMAWKGMACKRKGKTWKRKCMEWYGKDNVMNEKTWHGMERHGMAMKFNAWHGMLRHVMESEGMK
jgi:hypothetical protein